VVTWARVQGKCRETEGFEIYLGGRIYRTFVRLDVGLMGREKG
jgi:hypothetical protein